ncbi:MAG: uracil-DNA glycosylase [Candidatus Paceibacterota bacterium]|jgi:DNA polymerase
MNKLAELKKLEEEIIADTSLPLNTNLVFGEGSDNAEILFIGEAPGAEEDKQRRPFVGRSGQLLRKNIRDIGLKEEDVFITNIVKRRPPDNRDPSPEEIESYKPYLARQIEIINPKVIVTLGRFSMNYFLPMAKITRDQGRLFPFGERFVYPVLHPAAALRGNEMMKMFTDSFRRLPAAVKKCDEFTGGDKKAPQAKSAAQKEKIPEQTGLF